MMRLRPVWSTNLAGFLIGFGLFSAFVLIPQFVQTPPSNGYGFGSSVTQSGLFLVPSTLMMLFAAPFSGRLSRRYGSKVPLVLGAATHDARIRVPCGRAFQSLAVLRRLVPARDRRRASRSRRSRT